MADNRLNASRTRLLLASGFAILVSLVLLYDRLIAPIFSTAGYVVFIAILAGYSVLSWRILHKQTYAPVAGKLRDTVSRPLQVLLAEDNPINQQLAVELLKMRGHSVKLAGNGVEVMAALDRETFDVVLMDVNMPEMDGFQTTAAIREREKKMGGHLPIIAITGFAMKGDRERCLEAGMDAYLCKPIRSKDLFEAVEQATTA